MLQSAMSGKTVSTDEDCTPLPGKKRVAHLTSVGMVISHCIALRHYTDFIVTYACYSIGHHN